MYDGSVQCAFPAHKFTSKERDTESGLDNFGARYYSSSMGRFTIPDWAANATAVPYADFGNPQSLNLYSYVKNNPTTFGDPDGHDFEKAWSDVKTFAKSVYVRVSVGVGAELSVTPGSKPAEVKFGAAARVNFETSKDAILKMSKSVDLGISAGPKDHPIYGKGGSAEQTVLTIQNDRHLTGEEPPVVTTSDQGGHANSSEDKLGLGVDVGFPIVLGGEIGGTREGLGALKDSVVEIFKSLSNPGPPPHPTPPPGPIPGFSEATHRDKPAGSAQ